MTLLMTPMLVEYCCHNVASQQAIDEQFVFNEEEGEGGRDNDKTFMYISLVNWSVIFESYKPTSRLVSWPV